MLYLEDALYKFPGRDKANTYSTFTKYEERIRAYHYENILIYKEWQQRGRKEI